MQFCQFFGCGGKWFYNNVVGIGIQRSPPKGTVPKIQPKYQPPGLGVPAESFKNEVPTKSSKLGSRQKLQYQKYQPKYQPMSAGAGNLPIPARQPVLVKIPAPAPPSTYHTYLPLHSNSLC